jgi:AhpC/TSA family/Disulphide bond corrector protein DsbC
VELQRSHSDFDRQGIAVFAISYDSVAVLGAFAERNGITYPLLSDEGSTAIRELGLLNERVYEQHAAYGVKPQDRHMGTPYPGSFLLDETGIIVEKRFYQSYRERETGAGLLVDGFHGESSIHDSEVRGGGEGVSIRAWLDSATYRYFQRLLLSVELRIEPGLHVYGVPIPDGYIPLSIEVAPGDGIAAGVADLPEPHAFQIEGLEEQFVVYEGRVLVTLPVTFAKRDAGDQLLSVTVRYQACSTTDCLMPAVVSLELPVKSEIHVPSTAQ